MATALDARLKKADPVSDAYALAFQRKPTPKEQKAAATFIHTHGTTAFCRALLNSNELIYLE